MSNNARAKAWLEEMGFGASFGPPGAHPRDVEKLAGLLDEAEVRGAKRTPTVPGSVPPTMSFEDKLSMILTLSDQGSLYLRRHDGRDDMTVSIGVGTGKTILEAVDQCLEQYIESAKMTLNELETRQRNATRATENQRTLVDWAKGRVSAGAPEATPVAHVITKPYLDVGDA